MRYIVLSTSGKPMTRDDLSRVNVVTVHPSVMPKASDLVRQVELTNGKEILYGVLIKTNPFLPEDLMVFTVNDGPFTYELPPVLNITSPLPRKS